MIEKYGKKFLNETEKYRLVPFIGDDYNDNSILKYLMQQPMSEIQTIITADILFSDRARCLGLEYILYDKEDERDYNQTEKEDVIQESETTKEVVCNVTKNKKPKERTIVEKEYNSQIKNEREESSTIRQKSFL